MSGQEEPLAVCACGDFAGAAYYASHHNRSGVNDTPLVAEFESDMEGVAVDGRDFLYPLFQQGSDARARDLVERAFGLCARTYLDKAWGTTDQRRRIDLCRDARHDTQVVCGHHSNRLVLGGRCRTRFRSAFLVKAPVPAASVKEIHRLAAGWVSPMPDVDLDDVLGRRRE